MYVEGHQSNVGNNAADLLARTAARDIQEIPPERDWDRERIQLERKSALPVVGVPVVSKVGWLGSFFFFGGSPESDKFDRLLNLQLPLNLKRPPRTLVVITGIAMLATLIAMLRDWIRVLSQTRSRRVLVLLPLLVRPR